MRRPSDRRSPGGGRRSRAPSIDDGQSTAFETHEILVEENIYGLENVADLDQLPPTGATVIALPMKIEGGAADR